MVFSAAFNKISVIPWPSVSLVKGIGVPGVNQRPATSQRQTLYHMHVVSSTPHPKPLQIGSSFNTY